MCIMSAFLVFDLQDSLIFWHCDPKFSHFLVQQNKWHELATSDHDEMMRNLFTIHLTPWMSYVRTLSPHAQLAHSAPRLDLPNTHVAHCEWQQFMFVHLEHRESNSQLTNDDIDFRLQRKVYLFCELVLFLYGNAVHCIDKYANSLRILVKMLNKWDTLSHNVAFLVESVERLFLGFHLEEVFKHSIAHVEQLMKLQMYRQHEEVPTCYLLMYKDRLIYKQESGNSQLNQKDLLSVLLLSFSIELLPPSAGDLSSEDSNLDESLGPTDKCAGSYFQQLVFLKSSYSQQIPLPHIYRKVMISPELYFISLTQISSILTICLPTLIQSITELKQNFHLQNLNSRKDLDKLTSCVQQLAKYISKSTLTASQTELPSFHLSALQQLQEVIAKKSAKHEPTALKMEQADRILTLALRSIYNCYAEVAFKELYLDTFPAHMGMFEGIVCEVSELLQETFNICFDYIRVKNETNSFALGSGLSDHMDLETFIFIDRESGHFVLGHIPPYQCHLEEMLSSTILNGYRKQSIESQQLVIWSENELRFAYFCMSEQNKETISPATCDIARLLTKIPALDERQGGRARTLDGSQVVVFELFCIFKASTLNEQISKNNMLDMVKLIKLYKNG